MYALRWLTLAYVVVSCVITIADTWFEDTWYFMFLYAPFGTVFWFCFFWKLLGAPRLQKRFNQFGSFAIWNFLLIYLLPIGSAELILVLFEAAPAETIEQSFWALGYFLLIMLVLYLPYYLFGTFFPAMILKRSDTVRSALARSLRQAGYLLPRFFGIFLPISILSAVLYTVVQFADADMQPITTAGDINSFSLLLMAISVPLSVLSEAVFMVISKNAYLMNLRELGDLPEFDAEVFA
ncbi:hypothetical protein [Roseibium album]|uniref:Uncharacterized protein n=1 Tax=Roseibium album TaxID=311410 RepID=A0A0M7AA35_9HYPH|nr:hypothetical protein [Roseibium album]CTQ71322.1 hypothetical protein LA5096_02871 [Roseibium album]